jgi:hypothetical protein
MPHASRLQCYMQMQPQVSYASRLGTSLFDYRKEKQEHPKVVHGREALYTLVGSSISAAQGPSEVRFYLSEILDDERFPDLFEGYVRDGLREGLGEGTTEEFAGFPNLSEEQQAIAIAAFKLARYTTQLEVDTISRTQIEPQPMVDELRRTPSYVQRKAHPEFKRLLLNAKLSLASFLALECGWQFDHDIKSELVLAAMEGQKSRLKLVGFVRSQAGLDVPEQIEALDYDRLVKEDERIEALQDRVLKAAREQDLPVAPLSKDAEP